MRRTSPEKEQEVLMSILLGDTYEVVSKKTGVPVSTIKKIKKRNDTLINEQYSHILEEQAISTNDLLHKTNKRIARLLALEDMGAVSMSINDLVTISREMHRQSTVNSTPLKSTRNLTKIADRYQ